MSTTSTITELQRMTPSELTSELKLKRAELAKARLSVALGSEKNHAGVKKLKKDVARMSMVIHALQKAVPAKKVEKKASQEPKKSVQRSRSKSR